MIGWLQGFQWFYIYLGAVVSFAAISTGMLQFSKWRYRNRVEDKLVFSTMRVSHKVLEGGNIVSLRFGVALSESDPISLDTELA